MTNTITVGQMQQLTGRLDNIMGAASPESLKHKRLAQLHSDIFTRFDLKRDNYAKQICHDLINYALELEVS